MMRTTTVLAVGLLLGLSVAGCGGNSEGDKVATAGGGASAAASPTASLGDQDQALKFSQCMRANGVPNYPDPKFDGNGGTSITLPNGIDRQKVDAATQKCKQYLPNGGQPQKADPAVVAQLRKFAQCMRANGVPNFPDPTDAGLQLNNDQLGMDPNDARYQAAQQKCNQYQPGPSDGSTFTQSGNGGSQG
jgi:hypothetical protein